MLAGGLPRRVDSCSTKRSISWSASEHGGPSSAQWWYRTQRPSTVWLGSVGGEPQPSAITARSRTVFEPPDLTARRYYGDSTLTTKPAGSSVAPVVPPSRTRSDEGDCNSPA